jgi:hypothetical protein
MTNYLGAGYGEHRRADPQTSCDSTGSSNTSHHRAEPLFITGNKARDAAIGEPRIRAGEIIGWRFWKLRNGILESAFVSYAWRPGVFERSSFMPMKDQNLGYHALGNNFGYHAFKEADQAECEASTYIHWWPSVIGCVAMWGEVVEHEHGWRSEYAGVRSLFKITGDIGDWSKQRFLLNLREKYGCGVVTEL